MCFPSHRWFYLYWTTGRSYVETVFEIQLWLLPSSHNHYTASLISIISTWYVSKCNDDCNGRIQDQTQGVEGRRPWHTSLFEMQPTLLESDKHNYGEGSLSQASFPVGFWRKAAVHIHSSCYVLKVSALWEQQGQPFFLMPIERN